MNRRPDISARRAFTLIEIMVVVGIIAIIVGIGIPSLVMSLKREGMRKAVNDVTEVLSSARAQAILSGNEVHVMFYPLERRFSVGGSPPAAEYTGEPAPKPQRSSAPTSLSGQLPEEISIEMFDVNLLEYRESEWVRVRFFPNGTSDEMTLVLRSPKNEWQKISLEVTTGLATAEAIQ